MKKIINYKELSNLIKRLKTTNKNLVLVGGCFDLLHLGHIRFLKEAKKYGTVIVALESDDKIISLKNRPPIHKQIERAEVLAELPTVDYTILLPSLTKDQNYTDLTKAISPQFIIVTDGDEQLQNKTKQAQLVKAKLIIVPKINTPSTSQLAKLLDLE